MRAKKRVPWNKGLKMSEKTKKKMSLAHKGTTGHKMSNETKQKMRIAKLGKKHTPEHNAKVRAKSAFLLKGSKNPAWKGGVTPARLRIRECSKYKDWRQTILLRDDFTCHKCKQYGGKLQVHHRKKSFSKLLQEVRYNLPLLDLFEGALIYTPFWDIKNGITMCIKCHKKLHRKKVK